MINYKPTNLQFELTTRCNLKCPYCYRRMYRPDKDIDFDLDLLKNIPVEDVNIFVICGTIGDGIFYPKLKEFITESYRRNPNLTISISTNGTAHGKKWWIDLAKILRNKQHTITFGIDGLEDTHKIHRIGSSYKRVMENMKSFIEGGGNAAWQFIVFKHNEHQIVKASNIARELGCGFVLRKSCVFDISNKPEKLPVITNTEYGTIADGEIYCRLDKGELSILANGLVMPCCHIIEDHQNIYKFSAKSLKDYHLNDILKDGYIQKFWSGRYKRGLCQKCKIGQEDFGSVEEFVLHLLKIRRAKKLYDEREQKKEASNKQ